MPDDDQSTVTIGQVQATEGAEGAEATTEAPKAPTWDSLLAEVNEENLAAHPKVRALLETVALGTAAKRDQEWQVWVAQLQTQQEEAGLADLPDEELARRYRERLATSRTQQQVHGQALSEAQKRLYAENIAGIRAISGYRDLSPEAKRMIESQPNYPAMVAAAADHLVALKETKRGKVVQDNVDREKVAKQRAEEGSPTALGGGAVPGSGSWLEMAERFNNSNQTPGDVETYRRYRRSQGLE